MNKTQLSLSCRQRQLNICGINFIKYSSQIMLTEKTHN